MAERLKISELVSEVQMIATDFHRCLDHRYAQPTHGDVELVGSRAESLRLRRGHVEFNEALVDLGDEFLDRARTCHCVEGHVKTLLRSFHRQVAGSGRTGSPPEQSTGRRRRRRTPLAGPDDRP